MMRVVEGIFILDFIALIALLVGVIWSIGRPVQRLWPPPERRSWQFVLTWFCFGITFLGNALLIPLDWNTWLPNEPVRLLLGVPVSIVGTLAVGWGFKTLGARNTSGLKEGFIRGGPYRFTRNPQYLGDIFLFIGLSLIANSFYLWVTHGLLILVFVLTPLAEEMWLEEQYGELYRDYKRNAPRWL
jgi:protein-S-isoprenylcysteine O-methyltransferase Ste14